MTAPTGEIEDDVYDSVDEYDDGASFEMIRRHTGYPPQDIRRAIKSLIRDDDGIVVKGIEDREKLYTTQ